MTIFATTDADGSHISQNADIFAFETEREARAYLLKGYDPTDWNLDTAEIGEGGFGDCWIKVNSAPSEHDGLFVAGLCDFAPFAEHQLNIQAPGQHPGGRAWWIEPTAPVLVVTFIQEITA